MNTKTKTKVNVYSMTKDDHDELMATRNRPATQAPMTCRRLETPPSDRGDIVTATIADIEAYGADVVRQQLRGLEARRELL